MSGMKNLSIFEDVVDSEVRKVNHKPSAGDKVLQTRLSDAHMWYTFSIIRYHLSERALSTCPGIAIDCHLPKLRAFYVDR